MYNSGITASELINSVRGEADISPELPDSFLYRIINTSEQFIYTEILKEYVSETIAYADITNDKLDLSVINVPTGAANVVYDDVVRVFADSEEIERAGAGGVFQFPEKQLYYTKYDGNISFSLNSYPNEITVIYRLRPILKSEANDGIIAIPPEFTELIAARLRGESYKVANEDGLAAKWLSDYNTQLESFKIWAAARNERYGG